MIFDEIDSICRTRGSRSDNTGVGDNVVNQLLAKMDGTSKINNILFIGMTNRIDLLDEAFLRPGRMEVHVEISLPNESGRLEILNIHTSHMRENSIISSDVSLENIAENTRNYSGALIMEIFIEKSRAVISNFNLLTQ